MPGKLSTATALSAWTTRLPDMFVVLVVVVIVVYVIAHTLLNHGCQGVGIFDWPKGCG